MVIRQCERRLSGGTAISLYLEQQRVVDLRMDNERYRRKIGRIKVFGPILTGAVVP